MTPLRQRMLDALELRGHAARTREAYIHAVARLARHYRRSPDTLSAEEVQRYLLHLLRERQLARASVNQYGCAYRFLYGTVLGLDGEAFQIPLAPAPQRLPEILSREEIARLFAAARHPKSRSFLMLAYATGLRLSELCSLRVADIDSAADRRCIRVEQGKGPRRQRPAASDERHSLGPTGKRREPSDVMSSAVPSVRQHRRQDALCDAAEPVGLAARPTSNCRSSAWGGMAPPRIESLRLHQT